MKATAVAITTNIRVSLSTSLLSPDPIARQLEKELLELVNNTGVGAMGFGGTQTCLAVKVNVHPCHIASLPVAINIQCHSARHKSATL